VRTGGDVKTPKSRRSLQLPQVAHRGAPFVSGTRFDAEFRVLGNDGPELLSECVTVTVK
jgi:hypothetical protein